MEVDERLGRLNRINRIREFRERRNQIARALRDRSDLMQCFSDVKFCRRYRLEKRNVWYVLNLLQDDLLPVLYRNNTLPPLLQVLISLRFYASGAFQINVGDLMVVSQATVSRVVKRVSTLIFQVSL